MRKIQGEVKTIRQLLSGMKYSIDFYQREYKWQTKQVIELLEDLSAKFIDHYEAEHERQEVERYGHYFLGSIITSHKDGKSFIIDGQQRLTTLTILLIYLHNLQRGREDKVKVDDLIYSEKYSKRSFNLDVDERNTCMEALFNQQSFDETEQPESVRNIAARYRDIEQNFPGELRDESLPYFLDWLIENVHLVEITAYSDEDAYTIFETMNDRGLSLTPTDMLKGFLLANINDEEQKLRSNQIWKDRVNSLVEFDQEEDADAIKSWLRSKYAQTIRERKKGALPGDFDRIGTEFHRWVRENRDLIALDKTVDFIRFVQRDFSFYARQYQRLREASVNLCSGLETVFHNFAHAFTLQYPMLLAPLNPDDTEEQANQKLRLVGSFVDILLTRRLWNFKSITYNTMQYAVFLIIKEIRGKSSEELIAILRRRLDAEQENFDSNDRLRLHQQNYYAIHEILARITDHIETSSGLQSRYLEYVTGTGKNRYEVEHIWADKPERHKEDFSNAADFAEYRNRIGGLLLLPKTFNASFGDLPYEEKLEHYNAQNLLARSLHSRCYDHNPGFLNYVRSSGLSFRSHSNFSKEDLDARQELYRQIAKDIWSPKKLDLLLES
ncbi:MAG: DUF262 domain-containing protein [Acidobacteria bacterium]|nr:DUF262 domain-containing protein [Acidobacteriota bacterium]